MLAPVDSMDLGHESRKICTMLKVKMSLARTNFSIVFGDIVEEDEAALK